VTRDKITRESIHASVCVTLACGCQGKSQPKTSKPNPSIRMVCKAKLVETKWYMNSLIINYNHDLSPNKERYFKCNRILHTSVRRKIIVNDISEIGLS
jgi:hypothetical protein